MGVQFSDIVFILAYAPMSRLRERKSGPIEAGERAKRWTERVINTCPWPESGMHASFSVFGGSQCRPLVSEFTWTLTCVRPAPRRPDGLSLEQVFNGRCNSDEVCINGSPNEHGLQEATCVPHTGGSIAVQAIERELIQHIYAMFTDQLPGDDGGIGISLTRSNVNDPYHAAMISLTPIDENYHTLAHPIWCSNCSAVHWSHSPPGTIGYDMNLMLQHAADQPILHGWRN